VKRRSKKIAFVVLGSESNGARCIDREMERALRWLPTHIIFQVM
jgi:hypothetical protein